MRAALQHGWIHNQVQRLWYGGPMFRHERPQKGRYRQFHQLGVEVFGLAGPDIDAELIFMTARLWRQLGIAHKVRLEINSLGSTEARRAYRDTLVAYLREHEAELDADSRRRLDTNPLRVLDSKNPAMQDIVAGAPSLLDALDTESRQSFDSLRRLLDAAGIDYSVNPRLVRGLDYYSRTVFEWVTEELGAQGTVCAGGRYDALVEQLGGRPVPAIGFALGIERLVELLDEDRLPLARYRPHAYLVLAGEQAAAHGLRLAEQLRDALPQLRLLTHCGGGSFKSQMKKADRSGAQLALILGEEEMARNAIGIKYLREDRPQETVPQAQLNDILLPVCASA